MILVLLEIVEPLMLVLISISGFMIFSTACDIGLKDKKFLANASEGIWIAQLLLTFLYFLGRVII